MARTKSGIVYSCEITGVLGKSGESSQRFTITGDGRESSCSGGEVTERTKREVVIGYDLRDENLFLETVDLGTTITWKEFRGRGKEDFLRSSSIKVVHPGCGAGKKS